MNREQMIDDIMKTKHVEQFKLSQSSKKMILDIKHDLLKYYSSCCDLKGTQLTGPFKPIEQASRYLHKTLQTKINNERDGGISFKHTTENGVGVELEFYTIW